MENQVNETNKYMEFYEAARLELWSKYSSQPQYMKSMGYSFRELVIKCQFLGIPCNESDFEDFYDYQYGRCFRFNAGRDSKGQPNQIKSVYTASETSGLSMEIFVHVQDADNLLYAGSKHVGACIFISNNTVRPGPTESVEVAVNTHTKIGMQRSFSNRLGPPYSERYEDFSGADSFLYAYIKSQNRTYRKNDCDGLVIQIVINEICNCSFAGLETFNNSYKPCLLNQFETCKFDNTATILDMVIRKNAKLCPQECRSMIYSLSYSLSGYPSQAYAKLLLLNPMILNKFPSTSTVTFEKLSNSILSFNVHYNFLGYTLISEAVSVTLVSLF